MAIMVEVRTDKGLVFSGSGVLTGKKLIEVSQRFGEFTLSSETSLSVAFGCLRSLKQGQLVRWKMNRMTHNRTHPQQNGAIS